MTRIAAILFAVVLACTGLTAVAWLLAPDLVPASAADSTAAVATRVRFEEQIAVKHREVLAAYKAAYQATGWYGKEVGQPWWGAEARPATGERAIALREIAKTQDRADSDYKQVLAQKIAFEDQLGSAAIDTARTILLATGAGLDIILVAVVLLGRSRIRSRVNRVVLGSECAADLAEALHEIRASAQLTRRERARHRNSLPAMWCYAAFRAWTMPLRLTADRLLRK